MESGWNPVMFSREIWVAPNDKEHTNGRVKQPEISQGAHQSIRSTTCKECRQNLAKYDIATAKAEGCLAVSG